ncbi:MAG: hypothetical protein NT034_00845 [Candidatus Magasanikbacteria bacterium]|nr:hypothetical protein [Candidatus Magasanikbacteria bacterium]
MDRPLGRSFKPKGKKDDAQVADVLQDQFFASTSVSADTDDEVEDDPPLNSPRRDWRKAAFFAAIFLVVCAVVGFGANSLWGKKTHSLSEKKAEHSVEVAKPQEEVKPPEPRVVEAPKVVAEPKKTATHEEQPQPVQKKEERPPERPTVSSVDEEPREVASKFNIVGVGNVGSAVASNYRIVGVGHVADLPSAVTPTM